MGAETSAAVVTGPDGTSQSLGEFLRACKQASGMPVTKIVAKAGISRANFYLLEKNTQRPALTTLVGLFAAMGFPSHIPAEPDPALAPDLVVAVGEDEYQIDLQWSPTERTKSRERYLAAASTGLEAASSILSSSALGAALAGHGGARLGRIGGAGLGATLAASATPVTLPVLAVALATTARHLRDRRASNQADAAAAPSQEEVLADLQDTAATLSTEELEALLATMKAMRDAPPAASAETPGQQA